MSADFQYDVFLSHNQADKPRVRRLAERLKAAGVPMEAGLRLWWDEWVIRAGDILALKVAEGLEQSRVLRRCLSPTALAAGWVALERSTAGHRDPASSSRSCRATVNSRTRSGTAGLWTSARSLRRRLRKRRPLVTPVRHGSQLAPREP